MVKGDNSYSIYVDKNNEFEVMNNLLIYIYIFFLQIVDNNTRVQKNNNYIRKI